MPDADARLLRSGTTLTFASSLLCGTCPGACLLFLFMEGHGAGAAVITACFAATCVTAGLGEHRLARWVAAEAGGGGVARRPRVADYVAAAGLLTINGAAYFYAIARHDEGRPRDPSEAAIAVAGVGFAALALTAWRAVGSGQLQAHVVDLCMGPRRRGLVGLGWTKAIYETVWLATCALGATAVFADRTFGALAAVGAYGALFGLVGFAGVWVGMVVCHAILFANVRRYLAGPIGRGFEVEALVARPVTAEE